MSGRQLDTRAFTDALRSADLFADELLIPVAIRERVWGGPGLLHDVPSRLPALTVATAAKMRLRAAQRAGVVYGGRDRRPESLDVVSTRRIRRPG